LIGLICRYCKDREIFRGEGKGEGEGEGEGKGEGKGGLKI